MSDNLKQAAQSLNESIENDKGLRESGELQKMMSQTVLSTKSSSSFFANADRVTLAQFFEECKAVLGSGRNNRKKSIENSQF